MAGALRDTRSFAGLQAGLVDEPDPVGLFRPDNGFHGSPPAQKTKGLTFSDE